MKEKILADRYQLTEQIGMGGMAIVYKAVDLRTNHNVAVKVLRPEYSEDAEFVGRFQREAEAASKMTHHNIVNLLDVGMDGENRYLVMEYVQGKTLKEVIQERGRLSAPLACQITIRILSALEHAHRNGIIHRDIKPQNILVHADGHIKVADFGIARIADSATLTRGDMVMGSVHYFSPEQAKGEGARETSDLYSTGIVLYEMLTGRVPFEGETAIAVAMQHLHAQPTPIQSIAPDVPPMVVQVCMKAMEKNPAMRYQSARDMAADLRAALDNRGEGPVRMDDSGENIQQPRPHLREENAPGGKRKKRGDDKNNRKLKNLWTAFSVVLGIVVIVGLVFGIRSMIDRYNTTITVPDVVGKDVQSAKDILEKAGAQVQIKEFSSDERAAGIVFLQVPKAGDIIRKDGDSVLLSVSTGPKKQAMPDLVGKTYSEAVEVLKSMGITSITTERTVSSQALDAVVNSTPKADEPVDKNTSVTLAISGGEAVVPSFVGKTLEMVENEITDSKMTLNPTLEYETTEDPELHGKVAKQQPEAGSTVTNGSQVTLTIYQCEAVIRQTVFDVTTQQSDADQTAKVTIRAENSNMEWVYVNYIIYSTSNRTQTVNVKFPDNRDYICTVYVEGAVVLIVKPETGLSGT